MKWQEFRLSSRLALKPAIVETVYRMISEIDAVKSSWKLTGKLLPQTIERLTHSVIVTSTGSSNRIEGNRLNDDQVERLYKSLRIRKFRTRDEQEVAGYLEMLELLSGTQQVAEDMEKTQRGYFGMAPVFPAYLAGTGTPGVEDFGGRSFRVFAF